MKYIMMSRSFPKGHIREGQPTFFVEKILAGLGYTLKNLPAHLAPIVNDFQMLCAPEETKCHTIRVGERYKPGDMVSLRVWSDKPYASKQIEFAQVEVKKTWEFIIQAAPASYQTNEIWVFVGGRLIGCFHPALTELEVLAANDGLTIEDFISWFSIHPKKEGTEFKGQIISWSTEISY